MQFIPQKSFEFVPQVEGGLMRAIPQKNEVICVAHHKRVAFYRKTAFPLFLMGELAELAPPPQVQLMQVDVGEQRREDTALRCTLWSIPKEAVIQYSSLEESFNQSLDTTVVNALLDQRHQNAMVDSVKAFPDVTFYDPKELVDYMDATIEHRNTVHCAASRSETMRAIQKITFPDWLH